jgi:hypothetical protein
MTGRTVAAVVSLLFAGTSAGCIKFYEIQVETPIQAKIDVSGFQRVLVAGFLAGGSDKIDPNTETARLLRSQLRTKSDMRVVDADVIVLSEEVRHRAGVPEPGSSGPSMPERIRDEADLKAFEHIFSDAEYWKKIGEDNQAPLIVTGSVMFTEVARSGMVSRVKTTTTSSGIQTYQPVQEYADQKGYALTPKFVFIDGRSGQVLYSETFHEEQLYGADVNTPALSSYFELMDKLVPAFLNTLSTQRIRGSRVLIK